MEGAWRGHGGVKGGSGIAKASRQCAILALNPILAFTVKFKSLPPKPLPGWPFHGSLPHPARRLSRSSAQAFCRHGRSMTGALATRGRMGRRSMPGKLGSP